MWTIKKIKEELPAVPVRYMKDKRQYTGTLAGRMLDFPTLNIKVNGEWIKAEFAWETIMLVLNTNTEAIIT